MKWENKLGLPFDNLLSQQYFCQKNIVIEHDEIAAPYILLEKYIYVLALEMASAGNRHRANCIDTLSFPILRVVLRDAV